MVEGCGIQRIAIHDTGHILKPGMNVPSLRVGFRTPHTDSMRGTIGLRISLLVPRRYYPNSFSPTPSLRGARY
eukprot:130077-Rhodomonas_salina.1